MISNLITLDGNLNVAYCENDENKINEMLVFNLIDNFF